jgi:hypothetical protein
MKFLTINRMKDTMGLLPPATLAALFETSIAAIQQQKKEGRILDMYFSPGEGVLIGIHNQDNADKWADDLAKIPIMMYAEYKAYPLASFDEYVKKNLEAVKMAAKMTPPGPK